MAGQARRPDAGALVLQIMTQRVVVASNRGPVSYQFADDGSLSARRGGGGMIAGVMSGLAALGPDAEATWICAALSDADRAAARQGVPGDTGVRMLTSRPRSWTAPTTRWPTRP